MTTDEKFVLACAHEIGQFLNVDFDKLVEYFSKEKNIIAFVQPDWETYGDVDGYQYGITGDSIMRENFYDYFINGITDNKIKEWPRYCSKNKEKERLKEYLTKSIKEKFDYEICESDKLF